MRYTSLKGAKTAAWQGPGPGRYKTHVTIDDVSDNVAADDADYFVFASHVPETGGGHDVVHEIGHYYVLGAARTAAHEWMRQHPDGLPPGSDRWTEGGRKAGGDFDMFGGGL